MLLLLLLLLLLAGSLHARALATPAMRRCLAGLPELGRCAACSCKVLVELLVVGIALQVVALHGRWIRKKRAEMLG